MKINQAVILAGGIGSRTKTRVYDNNTPKVMLRINNNSMSIFLTSQKSKPLKGS